MLVLEELAEGGGLKEDDQDEGALVGLYEVSITLDSVLDLCSELVESIFPRFEAELIFLVLITLIDVNYSESDRQSGGKFFFFIGDAKGGHFNVLALLVSTVVANL